MKRIIPFTRYFLPAVLVSSALILLGLFGFFTKGFNLGVDFQAGVNQTVQLAYPVASISYEGKGNAEMTVSDTAVTLVFSGAETDSKTVVLNYKDNPTVADLAKALEALPLSRFSSSQDRKTRQALCSFLPIRAIRSSISSQHCCTGFQLLKLNALPALTRCAKRLRIWEGFQSRPSPPLLNSVS